MTALAQLRVKIFADGADISGMKEMYKTPFVSGFTTNPTLMRKSGVTDYRRFASDVLREIPDRPISFEVFADDELEMERQAREIASWGDNVFVKIPVTDTKRRSTMRLVSRLATAGVQLNVTALLTTQQVQEVENALNPSTPAYVSVFAGRIADTGRDPIPLMREAVDILRQSPKHELIWASPRELLNIFQADEIGCHVITVTNEVLAKLPFVGKSLADYSLETVQMFRRDAIAAGFTI